MNTLKWHTANLPLPEIGQRVYIRRNITDENSNAVISTGAIAKVTAVRRVPSDFNDYAIDIEFEASQPTYAIESSIEEFGRQKYTFNDVISSQRNGFDASGILDFHMTCDYID